MSYPPQGTITRAELNSVEADLAAHGIATTGIHGVGALNIAGFHSAGEEVSKVIWKDDSWRAVYDLDRSIDLGFTDVNLREGTSPTAKIAILRLGFKPDSIGTGPYTRVAVRKNDLSPTARPTLILDKSMITTATTWFYENCVVGMDSDGVIEYEINVGTGWVGDTRIDVLGYIE